MAEAAGLGGEIVVIDAIRGDDEGLAASDGDAAGGKRGDLGGVVGKQADPGDAKLVEHGSGDHEVAFVGVPAEGAIGIDGIEAAVLEGVGAKLADQADAAAFLGEIKEDPGAFLAHAMQGGLQLRPAIAAQAAEEVAGEAFGVETGERGRSGSVGVLGLADDDGHMLDPGIRCAEGDEAGVGRIGERDAGFGGANEPGGLIGGMGEDVVGLDGKQGARLDDAGGFGTQGRG